MRKLILLFAALAIVFANVVVACPVGYDPSDWKTTTFNGCKIGYRFCYGVIGIYEGFSLQEIIVYPPCTQDVYENNKKALTDQILKEIAVSTEICSLFVDEPYYPNYIPECPNGTLCLLRVDDGICYDGWEQKRWDQLEEPRPPEPPAGFNYVWVMRVCDDGLLRTCYNAIYFCWDVDEYGHQVLRMYKNGTKQGPDCPRPCNWNCEEPY